MSIKEACLREIQVLIQYSIIQSRMEEWEAG